MSKIYDQHDAAFKDVSTYLVLKDGKRAATIAFKYPRDGAGRLYAYVHWFGVEMTRGFASGCGYDKHSAAVASAVVKIEKVDEKYGDPESQAAFIAAARRDAGDTWDACLRKAGFEVFQAV